MLQSIFLGRNNADEPTPPETGIICDFDASAVDKCLNPFNDPCLLDDPVKTWISNNEPVNAIQPTFSKQPIFGFDGQINKNYVNFPGSEFMLIFDSKTLFNQNDMSIYIVSAILNPYSVIHFLRLVQIIIGRTASIFQPGFRDNIFRPRLAKQ